MSEGHVFPELVTGRDDDFAVRAWRVREGSSLRGEASCNITDRILEVPFGADPGSRVVRAHELMHARVSPHGLEWERLFADVSARALECAEELRVNTLLARLGFEVSLLRDGSEKVGGQRLAGTGDWGSAVCFLLAVLGTGAERDYLAGVRNVNASWLPGLRAIRKRALQVMDQCATKTLAATHYDEDGVPVGYALSTVVLARLITQSMRARPPEGPEELRRFRRSLEPGGRRPPTGRFAELAFSLDEPDLRATTTSAVRRRAASTTGTVMRHPGRLLTDDQQRAFTRVARGPGGVVVIDQSGSMNIEPEELAALLRRAPDALVVGYSHRPGDGGGTPNAWLLARRGRVSSHCPSGNVGNGVDGPILRWALAQRRRREPVVWVTDGQVTDSHDYPDERLTAECAALVVRHRIRLVADLDGVASCLVAGTVLRRPNYQGFGRIGRELGRMTSM